MITLNWPIVERDGTRFPTSWPESLQIVVNDFIQKWIHDRPSSERVRITYMGDRIHEGYFVRLHSTRQPALIYRKDFSLDQASSIYAPVLKIESSHVDNGERKVFWSMERDEPVHWVMSL